MHHTSNVHSRGLKRSRGSNLANTLVESYKVPLSYYMCIGLGVAYSFQQGNWPGSNPLVVQAPGYAPYF
jgi:hypothetical protein